jgi:hypothetical protein
MYKKANLILGIIFYYTHCPRAAGIAVETPQARHERGVGT